MIITKGHNCVVNLKKKKTKKKTKKKKTKKKRVAIPNKIWSMHMQNLIKFHQFVYKTLSGNEILTITEGHNSVVNLRNMICIKPNLNLVRINANVKFCQIPSIHSQDIEWK